MTRQVVAFDTETECFRPGCMAPPIVCISWQRPGFEPQLVHAGGIDDRPALELVENWLTTDTLIVGHNVAYDLAVICAWQPRFIPLVFKAYDEDRVEDTMIRQKLLDIAEGCHRGKLHKFWKDIVQEDGAIVSVEGERWVQHNYGLADLARRGLGRVLEKDEWRLRYGEFKNTPITQWPEGARKYPLEDARATLDIFQVQEVHAEYIEDRFRQAKYAWGLHLTQTWGLRTHGPSVDALEQETKAALANIEDGLKEEGLVRKNDTRDTRKAMARMVAVCKAVGKPIRLTDGGEEKLKKINENGRYVETKEGKPDVVIQVPPDGVHEFLASKGGISLDGDACEECGDDLLGDYAEASSLKKMLANDIPALRAGIIWPVHTSYGIADSGRSTARAPNVQNPKRSGKVYRHGVLKYQLPDVRECWMPRKGNIFAQADFSYMELCTLAQCCIMLFGESELAKTINAGRDPHTEFATSILGISYEEGVARKEDPDDTEFDNARQTAKVALFGLPGGLGIASLVSFARKGYNVILTEDDTPGTGARWLKAAWLDRFPEMRLFFAHCAAAMEENGGKLGVMQLPLSKRFRGGCFYCSMCNNWFQGWASDACKNAVYVVERACYAQPESVLYGSRSVLFCHDEILAEVVDDEHAHDKAVELGRLMVAGASVFLPDVPPRAKPMLAARWSKRAKPVYDSNKRLVPWQP